MEPCDTRNTQRVVAALLRYWELNRLKTSTFTNNQEANKLNEKDPFAFLLAASIDRGALAENYWCTPLWLKRKLGHLEPTRFAQMEVSQLEEIPRSLPKKPRFPRQAAETIKDLSMQVVERYGGGASRIWEANDREALLHA